MPSYGWTIDVYSAPTYHYVVQKYVHYGKSSTNCAVFAFMTVRLALTETCSSLSVTMRELLLFKLPRRSSP